MIPTLGGPARRLTESGSHPSWSPDGRWIAYQSAGGFVVTEDTRVAQPPGTLWLVAADGGEPHRLTEPGTPRGGHAMPRWSPDGRHLVFASQDVGQVGAVWALCLADKRLERAVLVRSSLFEAPLFRRKPALPFSVAVLLVNWLPVLA